MLCPGQPSMPGKSLQLYEYGMIVSRSPLHPYDSTKIFRGSDYFNIRSINSLMLSPGNSNRRRLNAN